MSENKLKKTVPEPSTEVKILETEWKISSQAAWDQHLLRQKRAASGGRRFLCAAPVESLGKY